MAKLFTEADIKPAFKFATGATKKLVTAGVTAADNFPELLSKYKWSGTRDYNMAMIIIALFAYCAQQDDETLKQFGMSAKTDKQKNAILERLEEGKGKEIVTALEGHGIGKVMDIILKNIEEDSTKREKITKAFTKQFKTITP